MFEFGFEFEFELDFESNFEFESSEPSLSGMVRI